MHRVLAGEVTTNTSLQRAGSLSASDFKRNDNCRGKEGLVVFQAERESEESEERMNWAKKREGQRRSSYSYGVTENRREESLR